MSDHVALSVKDLCFSYQVGSPVLEHATFEVKQGEYIGVIGPNGGGKTTLFKLILGFLKPRSGSIALFGKKTNLGRKGLAYVPQALHADRDFPISVEEVVLGGCLSRLSYLGRYRTQERDSVLEILNDLDLIALKNQPFGSLSGGQAQKTLIARALVAKPEILLLDEPTAGVDARAEGEIYEMLKNLQGKMTILMVTHNLSAVIENVQRVICVERTVRPIEPEKICEHFAVGLYHTPLLSKKKLL